MTQYTLRATIATPDHIVAVIGSRHESAQDHIKAMGLTAISVEEDFV